MRDRLVTARLDLQLFTAADAPELHALFSDPATNTIGSGLFTAIEQTDSWISNRASTFREHGLAWYAVRLRAGGALVGNCGTLRGRATHTEPELGYMISRECQSRGYATEAAIAVVAECATSGIGRLWATIRPANLASRRVIERVDRPSLDRTEEDDRGQLLWYTAVLNPAKPPSASGWTGPQRFDAPHATRS